MKISINYTMLKDQIIIRLLLVLFCISFFSLLCFRNSGLMPIVIGDELLANLETRLVDINNVSMPQYIYYLLYKISDIWKYSFLEGARFLNAFFYASSTIFIFIVANKILHDETLALIVSIFSVMGPINSYSAYFMPESMFFFTFWLFTWFILQLDPLSKVYKWAICGILYAILCMVKVHGIFILPALLFYITVLGLQKEVNFKIIIFLLSVFLFSFFLFKFGFGFLVGGENAFTFLGKRYGSILSDNLSVIIFFKLLCYSFVPFILHIISLSFLFSIPLCFLFVNFTRKLMNIYSCSYLNQLDLPESFIYFMSILLNMIIVVSLFTVYITLSYPEYESMTRVHFRYYSYIFPFFYIVSAYALNLIQIKDKIYYSVCTVIALFVSYALLTKIYPASPIHVDAPGLTVALWYKFCSILLFFSFMIYIIF